MSVALTFPAPCLRITADDRVRAVADAHYESLWRFLRRMGVCENQVEDAAQQALMVFAQRNDDVAEGAERSFLFNTALRVASDFRRKSRRGLEISDSVALLQCIHPGPDAEHQLADRELRQCLDRILDELAPELRAVLVLADLEELTMAEISKLLSIPPGTVASRLRRARELFETKALALKSHLDKGVDP